MSRGEGGGRPTKFNEETAQKVLESIPKVLTLRQSSAMARISHTTLQNWMKLGKEEEKTNPNGDFAMFFANVRDVQAKELHDILKNVRAQTKNWQASAWLLERCFREDFGNDSHLIQDMLKRALELEEKMKKFIDDPLKRSLSDGGEMDSESD